jgi:hypothetical protein
MSIQINKEDDDRTKIWDWKIALSDIMNKEIKEKTQKQQEEENVKVGQAIAEEMQKNDAESANSQGNVSSQ